MPDQNNTSQTQDQPATTTAPPVPPVMDSPKVSADTTMPDFQNAMTEDVPPMPQDNPQTTTSVKDVEGVGSAAPSDLPDVTVSTPKKKFGGGKGKVIATILGVLLLVGGVGAGLIITQQRQLFQQQARTCVDSDCALTGGPDGKYHYEKSKDRSEKDKDYPKLTETQVDAAQLDASGLGGIAGIDEVTGGGGDGSGGQGSPCVDSSYCANGYSCVGGTCQGNPITTTCGRDQDPGAPVCCTSSTCSGSIVCEEGKRKECKTGNVHCTIDADSADCGGANQTTDENGGPTPTPGLTASCQNIKAYSDAWVLLTPAQLSDLNVGDEVNFCVLGVASSGTFDMARFTINGSLKPNTTTVRPGTTDFCQNYTIPAATTVFNVSAEIHHASLGWK